MSEPTLTAELSRGILAAIRAGGFPHVAAAAYGVDAATWRRWRRRGRRGREPYRTFWHQVETAHGQARLRAEIEVLDKDVRTWLKHGPGRDLPGQPGWAALARAAAPAADRDTDRVPPELLRFAATVRAVLAPYPEALAALAKALDGDAAGK